MNKLPQPRTFVFDVNTGETLRPIASGYRWALRHMREITRVEVMAIVGGGALVTLYLDNGHALRETWASCMLANRRYIRWSRIHGFEHKFYDHSRLPTVGGW